MGDMADYCNSTGDWFSSPKRKTIRCKHCGSTNVYWYRHGNGSYCLFDKATDLGHVCKKEADATSSERKRKLSGWKEIRSCNNCQYYFIGGRCIKHDFETGGNFVCKTWSKE